MGVKAKEGKAMQLRHAGAKRERKYSFLLILDLGTRGGEWSASRPGSALPQGKGLPAPIE
jgi:hypothetical protein